MKIITISREFGSGGRELGKRLADALGIPCYDHEIIEMIAKENGSFVTKNIPSTFVDGVSVSRPVGDIIAVAIPKK